MESISISKLLNGSSVTHMEIKLLRKAGIYTLFGLIDASVSIENLQKQTNLSLASLNQMIEIAYTKLPNSFFLTASELQRERYHVLRLSTGSNVIDQLLLGGIETGLVTEICGPSRSGKTQLAFTMAVTSQIPFQSGGGNGKCIFLDTHGTFRSERILDIAVRYGINPETVMDNVMVGEVANTAHLLNLLQKSQEYLEQDWIPLMIIDSLGSLVRGEYPGTENLNERNALLSSILKILKESAIKFQMAVIINNVTYANFAANTGGNLSSAPLLAYGGNVTSAFCNLRLMLGEGRRSGERTCKIVTSSLLPENQCSFFIRKGGISDE